MLSDFIIFQNKHFVAFMYSGKLVADLFEPIKGLLLNCSVVRAFLFKSPSQNPASSYTNPQKLQTGLYND